MYFVYFVVALVLSLLAFCTQPTDSPDEDVVERERISVSGSISEDAVWEIGDRRPETGGRRKEEKARTAVSLLFFCLFFLPSPFSFILDDPA